MGQPGDDQRDAGDEGNDPHRQDAELEHAQAARPAEPGGSGIQGFEPVGGIRGYGFPADESFLGLPRRICRVCRVRSVCRVCRPSPSGFCGCFRTGQDAGPASGRTRRGTCGLLAGDARPPQAGFPWRVHAADPGW